ncbi:MAG: hydantoinase/oxoprolinase family protein, partial [Pseudomonadales bacterium]
VGRGLVNIIHGTTVATNATLEGKGVRTAYITNKGMKDVLSIGRQTRLELYNLAVTKKTITPEEDLLFEVDVRCAADGAVIKELDASELAALTEEVRRAEPEAIAVNLLFSFVNDEHERLIEAALAKDFFVSRSSAVLPEYREYERGVATWVNAWLGPIINDYLLALSKSLEPSQVAIMQSSGLTIAAAQAAGKAVNLLLSGPAGGLAAAQMLARLTGKSQLMTFDMGGTSTDVSLLQDGIRLSSENHIAGLPIAIPMADIHTIGAGGGSIAYVDEGGLLQVGPHSAGADPGPACYGLGGKDATVTDANLLLGRLNPDAFLRGEMALDMDAANAAVNRVAQQLGLTIQETAQGIVDIASELMAQALRVISIERGHDPRDYTLVCFGGAGGMHLCQLAETLEITEAIVPVHAGVLSALGMLATKPGREMTRTHRMLLD